MRPPITLYVRPNAETGSLGVMTQADFDRQIVRLGIDYDELAAADPQLKRYTITLHDPFTQAMQIPVDNGSLNNPGARPGLMFAAYVKSHDIPMPLLSEPNVINTVAREIELRVFPSILGDPDFLAVVSGMLKPPSNSSPDTVSPSKFSPSNGESCIAA